MKNTRKNLMFSLADKIRNERMRRNMTQYELAETADISQHFLSCIENGRKIASVETYLKIAVTLGLRLSDLFNEETASVDDELQSLLCSCNDFERNVCVAAIRAILVELRKGNR